MMKENINFYKLAKFSLVLLLFFPLILNAQVTAVKAKKIYTVSHGVIENGVILIRDGKIEDVGTNVEIPWNAEVIDFSQNIIVPGLIEAHAARGYDVPNETNPLTPFVTVLDNIDTSHDTFKAALREGVTTLSIMPGNNTILGGKGAIVKPIGLVVEDVLIVPESGMKISVVGTSRTTRMGALAQLRRYFNETKEYMKKQDEAASEEGEKMVSTPGSFRSPEYVKYESVADLLKGRYKAFVYCKLPSDLIRAQKLTEKYGFQSVYILSPECYKAADFIAENKLKIILDPEIIFFEKNPVTEEIKKVEVAKVFHAKGIEFALQSNPARIHTRSLFYQGMRAMSCGLSPEDALKAVTLIPAQILEIDNLAGSIDKGKLANFAVLDNDFFNLSTHVEFLYIEGKRVYDREKDEELKNLMSEKITR